MQVERLQAHMRPLDNETVRVKETGNVIEVMYQQRKSSGGYITKLDANYYIDNRSGEVKEFKRTANRAEAKDNVAKTMAMGRDMLNANITDVKKCRWVTLTYAENMTDAHRAYLDFKAFNILLRRKYGHYEYITAIEPQARGAWHYHVVMIFDDVAPYLEPQEVAKAWGKGFVKVRKLDDVDNVGAYLTAYLGDIAVDECKDIKGIYDIKTVEVDIDGKKVKKSYAKGARLSLYPSGMHIFRWSRGVKKPVVTYTRASEAQKKVSEATLTYEKTVKLSDAERGYDNMLNYRYYNTKRK